MVDNLVNSIGGYDSWHFLLLAWGLSVGGLALIIYKYFLIPIPVLGLGLMYLLINHYYLVALPNIKDPLVSGLASCLPILATAIGLFVVIDPTVVARMFGSDDKKEN